jgi:hypothetical protein
MARIKRLLVNSKEVCAYNFVEYDYRNFNNEAAKVQFLLQLGTYIINTEINLAFYRLISLRARFALFLDYPLQFGVHL